MSQELDLDTLELIQTHRIRLIPAEPQTFMTRPRLRPDLQRKQTGATSMVRVRFFEHKQIRSHLLPLASASGTIKTLLFENEYIPCKLFCTRIQVPADLSCRALAKTVRQYLEAHYPADSRNRNNQDSNGAASPRHPTSFLFLISVILAQVFVK